MQGVNENKLRNSIKLKNTKLYIRGTVVLKFLFFLLVGIFLGGMFFHSQYVDKIELDCSIADVHFGSIFVGCETFSECLFSVIMLSELEIRYLILIFISGFTYFCFIASAFMMIGRGFLLGFSLSYLIYIYLYCSSTITRSVLIAYLLFNVISSFILIFLSVASYTFSFDFRAIKRNHFVLRRAPIIYKYSFSLIIALGGLLLNKFFYCVYFYIT